MPNQMKVVFTPANGSGRDRAAMGFAGIVAAGAEITLAAGWAATGGLDAAELTRSDWAGIDCRTGSLGRGSVAVGCLAGDVGAAGCRRWSKGDFGLGCSLTTLPLTKSTEYSG